MQIDEKLMNDSINPKYSRILLNFVENFPRFNEKELVFESSYVIGFIKEDDVIKPKIKELNSLLFNDSIDLSQNQNILLDGVIQKL